MYYGRRRGYGRERRHNAAPSSDRWLHGWEKAVSVAFHQPHPEKGYRRLPFMVLDDEVVAASLSTVYRVLKRAGRPARKTTGTSLKGKGFTQPARAHEHWHLDVETI